MAWAKDKARLVQSWLQEGADPLTLAKSAGIGFALGLCPILGVTTLLCLGALVVAKWIGVELHTAMALLANLISVPVEVLDPFGQGCGAYWSDHQYICIHTNHITNSCRPHSLR